MTGDAGLWFDLNPDASKNLPSETGKKAGKLYLNGPKHSGLLNPDAMKNLPSETGKKAGKLYLNGPKHSGLLNPDAMKNLPSL